MRRRPPRPAAPDRQRGRRRRLALVGAVGAALTATLLLPGGTPVGHFTSADAHDRFRVAYDRALADLPVPERVRDLRTGYGVVRVYQFASTAPQGGADAVPIVLLPGRGAASPVWADNLPGLRRLAPVYAIDLLGEPGLSVQARPIVDDAEQAAWLHEVLAQLPEPRVDLLGMSIGGWTAANLAVHRPERVRSLVLLDPVLVFAPLAPAAVVRSVPASVRWFPRAWRDDFASWTANGAPVEDEPVAAMIEAGLQTYALALPPAGRPTEQELAGLDRPVLVVVAGRSRLHDPVRVARTATDRLPRARVVVYADASHAVNGEQPARIAADVAAFRDSL